MVADPVRTDVAVSSPVVWDRLLGHLPEPELVEAEGRDGARIHARRYAAGRGRMLCWVHGGPTDQWMVDWNPRLAYWWSRGWDVVVVDPRGTTGHGRSYQRAMNGGWGRVDVDDTAALIRHAHVSGWATPATTVAMGGSAGGLTVLGVLADHAELVAGGVTRYPVSDIAALAEATHRFEAHYNEHPRRSGERHGAVRRAVADHPRGAHHRAPAALPRCRGPGRPAGPERHARAGGERTRGVRRLRG